MKAMTEQDLLDEAKARANIATQKMNEQFHNESVKSDIDEVQQIESPGFSRGGAIKKGLNHGIRLTNKH